MPLAARSRSKVLNPQRAEKRGESRDRTLAGRAGLWLLAVLISLAASTLVASEKARTFRLRVGDASLRVTVPKTFEPLLPGSVYPNRRKPVEARGLPVAILAHEAQPAFEFLLEREFLVVERRSEPVEGILQALAARPEADPNRAALVAFRTAPPTPAGVRATVIFDPDPEATPPLSGSSAVALFLRTPRLVPSEELSRGLSARFGAGVVEKWYWSDRRFPEQAYRDAAEWAAEVLSR